MRGFLVIPVCISAPVGAIALFALATESDLVFAIPIGAAAVSAGVAVVLAIAGVLATDLARKRLFDAAKVAAAVAGACLISVAVIIAAIIAAVIWGIGAALSG